MLGQVVRLVLRDPDVDSEEWVTFVERIEEHFRSNYENFPDEFFFWRDFSGDRTLDMKISQAL
jgi:hypothetical protein